jgi:alpha-glucosidase
MKPLRTARLKAKTDRGVWLDCGENLVCRVSLLTPDLARVIYVRGEACAAPRTWMVPAFGEADTPWEGRDRLEEDAWPPVPLKIVEDEGMVVLESEAMRLTIALAPFAMTFALPDGRIFARERAAHAVSFGARGLRHAFQRDAADRYYGLGDKIGKLDLHGRRLRVAMRDSLGFDPEFGDPLYKHWPFLILRDGGSGVASGLFYDNMAAATFDLGCEHDNYYGLYRAYEAEGGDLDFYVFPGPSLADVTRKFVALTGRPALPPRWSLGFAQTAMAIADAPDAQARMEDFLADGGFPRALQSGGHPGQRVPFRLRLHLDRPATLRLQLEFREVPRSQGADARLS